jgi:chromosome segregation ATPase
VQLEAEARLSKLQKEEAAAEASVIAQSDARKLEALRSGEALVQSAAKQSDERISAVRAGAEAQISRLHALEDELLRGQATAEAESARLAAEVVAMRSNFSRLMSDLTMQQREAVRGVLAEGQTALNNARSHISKQLTELQASLTHHFVRQ